jgi:cyclophilin family peptidyl-prolyl cis-trans isomerase
MIQTGDPTGTGKGGQSIWGRPFADEIRTTLKFNARGILAMANSGPDTNKSQFFVSLDIFSNPQPLIDSPPSNRSHILSKHTWMENTRFSESGWSEEMVLINFVSNFAHYVGIEGLLMAQTLLSMQWKRYQ